MGQKWRRIIQHDKVDLAKAGKLRVDSQAGLEALFR